MDGKDTALSRTALDGDVTMMGLHDMFDNGEAEDRAALSSWPR